MIGEASGSVFWMVGGSAVCGRRFKTVLTLSRTSCVATSGSLERSKAMVMEERPVLEEERSSSMPVAVLTAPSMTSVTSDSISAGAEREEGEAADHRQREDDDGGEDRAADANLS